MKSTIKTLPSPPPAFTPFELAIRVETVEEARSLAAVYGMHGTACDSAYYAQAALGNLDLRYPGVTKDSITAALGAALRPVYVKFS